MLALLPLAAAAEIQVQASRPVVVSVEGAAAGVAGTMVDTLDLPAGEHRVQIRNFAGSLLAEGRYAVAETERLRLRFDRETRALVVLDRVPIGGGAPLPDPPPTPPPPAPRDGVQGKGPAPAVALADSPTGSLLVTGLSDLSGAVTISGAAVLFAADRHGFLATGLSGSAEVRVEEHGAVRHLGAVEVVPGGHQVCQLVYRQTAWTLDCALVGPEIAGP